MTKQYWVMSIDNIVVEVENKPEDRMDALKRIIMGTGFVLDDNALWFADNGGSCKLGHGLELTETNDIGVYRMIDDSISTAEKQIENLKILKRSIEA